MNLLKRIHDKAIRDIALNTRHHVQPDDYEEDNICCLEQLYIQASISLYNGSLVSMISVAVVILNMSTTHGISNTFQK
jgi:hypothetical protein